MSHQESCVNQPHFIFLKKEKKVIAVAKHLCFRIHTHLACHILKMDSLFPYCELYIARLQWSIHETDHDFNHSHTNAYQVPIIHWALSQ